MSYVMSKKTMKSKYAQTKGICLSIKMRVEKTTIRVIGVQRIHMQNTWCGASHEKLPEPTAATVLTTPDRTVVPTVPTTPATPYKKKTSKSRGLFRKVNICEELKFCCMFIRLPTNLRHVSTDSAPFLSHERGGRVGVLALAALMTV